jgi:transcriptional regulator with XRE-family HTH domain
MNTDGTAVVVRRGEGAGIMEIKKTRKRQKKPTPQGILEFDAVSVGERIDKIFTENGIRSTDIAHDTGVDRDTIDNYRKIGKENYPKMPQIDKLLKVIQALTLRGVNVNLYDLLGIPDTNVFGFRCLGGFFLCKSNKNATFKKMWRFCFAPRLS